MAHPQVIPSAEKRKPKFVYKGKPTFKTKMEEYKWWEKEIKRWSTGYGGLTGFHYFYLTQIMIEDGRGKPIRPLWRDGDDMVCHEYKDCLDTNEDLAIYKRREFGLSSMFGAAMPLWWSFVNPGSTQLQTSNDRTKTLRLFTKKLMTSVYHMDPWLLTKKQIESARTTGLLTLKTNHHQKINGWKEIMGISDDDKEEIIDPELSINHVDDRLIITGNTFAVKDELKDMGAQYDPAVRGWVFDEERIDEVEDYVKTVNKFDLDREVNRYLKDKIPGMSNVIARQTSDRPKDATNFESERAVSAFIDEMFLHPYAGELRGSMQACMQSGFVKNGAIVLGGSCGLMSKDGAHQAEEIWLNGDAMGVRAAFIEGTKCIMEAPEIDDLGRPKKGGKIYNFCPNGYSDEEGAREWILSVRSRLEKLKDKKPYYQFVKSYPLKIDELFEINRETVMPEDIVIAAAEQRKIVIKDPANEVKRYQLFRDKGKLKSKLDSKGPFYLRKPPNKDFTYIMGTDPIPMVEKLEILEEAAKGRGRSLHATAVKCRETQEYDGYYLRRTNDASQLVAELKLLHEFFYDPKNMVEKNVGGVLMLEYRNQGIYHLLADQPTAFGRDGVKRNQPKGFHKDGNSAQYAYDHLYKYLREHMDKVKIERILTEIPLFILENTDLLDAVVMCEVYDAHLKKKEKKSHGAKVKIETSITVFEGNYRKVKWVTQYVDEDSEKLKKIQYEPGLASRGRGFIK